MKTKQIIKMLRELFQAIDYDIYKYTFVSPEEPEEAADQIEEYVTIVKKHTK